MARLPEWSDLRVFLAVARLGTISLAGERLRIEHSTVSRRIDRLEESLGVVLFDRRRSGYTLTEAGEALLPNAERMESALIEAVEETTGMGARVEGTVRVGTPEAFGIHVLTPSMIALRRQHPALHVQLIAKPQFPSLSNREVEILVTLEPPEMGRYKVAKLGHVDFFLYCSPDYRDAHPKMIELSDAAQHPFVDYAQDGSINDRLRVVEDVMPDPARSFTAASVLAQRAAAAAGMGLALLTPYVAERDSDLVCVLPGRALADRSLWIAAPEDLLRTRRVRVVWDHILDLIERRPEYFRRSS